MGSMATTVDIVHFIEMAISCGMSFHRTTGIGWGNGGFFGRTLKFAIGFPREDSQKAQEIGTAWR